MKEQSESRAALQYWASKDQRMMKTLQNKGHNDGVPYREERQDHWLTPLPTAFSRALSWGHVHAMQKDGCVQAQKNTIGTEYLVFKDYLRICAHLSTHYVWVTVGELQTAGERNKWCTEVKVHRDGRDQKSQIKWQIRSVKYAEGSVEIICIQWHLYYNIGGHRAGSWYDLNTAMMSCPPQAATHQGQGSLETIMPCAPCETIRVLPSLPVV